MLILYLIFIPFISSFLCLFSGFFVKELSKWIALITMIILMILSIWLYNQITCIMIQNQDIQWPIEYIFPWISSFGINIHLALDSLSLIMILLNHILGIFSILCSWNNIKRYQKFFYCNLLWIIGSVTGLFLALDMFLFFFFWEIIIIPMYFLITLWGHKGSNIKTRIYAANKFFIYNQLSGLIILLVIIGLVIINYKNTNILSFSYKDLLFTSMSDSIEYLFQLGLFIAFAIKMPIIPFHTWLINVHSQAPTAGSVDLSGILLKTAAYGLLRFNLSLFPHASYKFTSIAILLGVITIIYGALMAFSQKNIKHIIAYSSISHMGYILIAIYSHNYLAYQGAIIQMITHGLSAAGMFIISGQLYERLQTYDIRMMGGLYNRINFLPTISLFFALATLGIPGTGNFIGEILILFGSYSIAPLFTIIATFGLLLATIYSLFMIQRIYYGSFKSLISLRCLKPLELIILLLLIIMIILIGINPQPILNFSALSINNIYNQFISRAI